jgi:hypothetical protein
MWFSPDWGMVIRDMECRKDAIRAYNGTYVHVHVHVVHTEDCEMTTQPTARHLDHSPAGTDGYTHLSVRISPQGWGKERGTSGELGTARLLPLSHLMREAAGPGCGA